MQKGTCEREIFNELIDEYKEKHNNYSPSWEEECRYREISNEEEIYFVFTSSLSVKGIEISPKDSIKGQDLSSSIKEIDIVQINILKLLKKKEFSASKIKIIQPDIVLYPLENNKNEKKSKLGQSIDIDKIEIVDGDFKFIKKGEYKPAIETNNINKNEHSSKLKVHKR